MPGYKNYTIKKYEKGGLVETKSYKDGKTVLTKEDIRDLSIKQSFYEDEPELKKARDKAEKKFIKERDSGSYDFRKKVEPK